jgi:hypothetical protein
VSDQEAVRARRIVLSADELELLRRLAGVVVPPDFAFAVPDGVAGDVSDDDPRWAGTGRSLVERGLAEQVAEPGVMGLRPHPSLVANLGVLAAPELVLRTQVRRRGKAIFATHAVAGLVGAGIARIDERGVELSMFAPTGLAAELERVAAAAGDASDSLPRPLEVPYAALVEVFAAVEDSDEEAAARAELARGMSPEAVQVLIDLDLAFSGSLRTLVAGRRPTSGEVAVAGEVVWLYCDGWVGVTPTLGPDNARRAKLAPVAPAELGSWVAPLVAAAVA